VPPHVDDLPERTIGLVIKRTLGAEPSSAYGISHVPASTPCAPGCVEVVCAGPRNNAAKKAQPRWGWTTMQSANRRAGIAIG